MIKHSPPDPDKLPYIGPDELRKIRIEEITSTQYIQKAIREREGVNNFAYQQKAAINHILGSTGLRLSEPKVIWSGIATTPIDILSEPIEQVATTALSIAEAADKISEPLLYLPWLNFTADHRRERDKIARATKKAELMKDAIQDTIKGHNITSNMAFDHLPHGTTIAGIRQRMLLGALGIADRHINRYGHTYSATRKPYLSVDADTTISDDTLVIAKEPLELDQALFVSGNLYYVGEIMETSTDTLRQQPKAKQLLYTIEHLRRLMLNSLPPIQPRGYLPETGMTTTLSILANLGGYNSYAENNESYWLEAAAEQATRASLRRCRFVRGHITPSKTASQSSIQASIFWGQTLESITRYENYSVYTSIEGVERSTRKLGAAAVVAFDQGPSYTMRTQTDNSRPSDIGYSPPDPPDHLVINAAYSYYKLCGGELTVEGLLTINELINNFQLIEKSKLKPGQLAWTPQYIPKKEWPTGS